jgi:hypothetical protein
MRSPWSQRLRDADRIGGWKRILQPFFEGLLKPPPLVVIAL